ncbi:MAG: hypothetical protein KBE09_05425 [Candidatus Pacebacteria bacterium]|nr:hypothetical protein [Candidatus Paceibacterota bacterium]
MWFKGVHFPYPLMVAGGIVKTVDHAQRLIAADTMFEWGSFTTDESLGNGGRDYYAAYTAHSTHELDFTLNSIGLTNPGMKYAEKHGPELCVRARDKGHTFWINLSGVSVRDTVALIKRAIAAGFKIITVNGSCPNRPDHGGKGRAMPILCYDTDATSELFAALDKEIGPTEAIILWKISAGMPQPTLEHNIRLVATSQVMSGMVACNTVPNGFALLDDGKPAIQTNNGIIRGGVGGPAIFPIVLGHVHSCATMLHDSGKMVIGTGGVHSAERIRAMRRAGAFITQTNSTFREANENPTIIRDLLQDLIESA